MYFTTTRRPYFETDCTKFGALVDLTVVITPTKFGSKEFINVSRPRGGKKHFLFSKQTCPRGLWSLCKIKHGIRFLCT